MREKKPSSEPRRAPSEVAPREPALAAKRARARGSQVPLRVTPRVPRELPAPKRRQRREPALPRRQAPRRPQGVALQDVRPHQLPRPPRHRPQSNLAKLPNERHAHASPARSQRRRTRPRWQLPHEDELLQRRKLSPRRRRWQTTPPQKRRWWPPNFRLSRHRLPPRHPLSRANQVPQVSRLPQ